MSSLDTETLAENFAADGRDELIRRFRDAYSKALGTHSDLVQFDTSSVEAMVQGAVAEADGLQWRRAIAGVAARDLGIDLGAALVHPAVIRAHQLTGAPTYESALAGLALPVPAPPIPVAPAPQVLTTSPSLAASDPVPVSLPGAKPPPAAEAVPEPLAGPEPIAVPEPVAVPEPEPLGEPMVEAEPELLADPDSEVVPTPTEPLTVIDSAPQPEAEVAVSPVLPSSEPEPQPPVPQAEPEAVREAAGGSEAAAGAPGGENAGATQAYEIPTSISSVPADSVDLPAVEDEVEFLDEAGDTPLVHRADEFVEEFLSDNGAGADDTGNADFTYEHDVVAAPLEGDFVEFLAVHLGGVATLPSAEEISLRLSEDGLDLLHDDGTIVGRLTWTDIAAMEVTVPHGRRRRRGAPRLVVHTAGGSARLEVPELSGEELQEQVQPLMERFGH